MSNTIKIQGELELDFQRGVIYFHSSENGQTILRICKLPKQTSIGVEEVTISFIDIAHI